MPLGPQRDEMKMCRSVEGVSLQVFTVAVVTILGTPAGCSTEHGPDDLVLMYTNTDSTEEASKRSFLDCYVPDLRVGPLILRAERAPFEKLWLDVENIPTSVDGESIIPHGGRADLRPGSHFQYLPVHNFFWSTHTASGWLLAKLKAVGELDAFMPPFLLAPKCYFNTNLKTERWAEYAKRGIFPNWSDI